MRITQLGIFWVETMRAHPNLDEHEIMSQSLEKLYIFKLTNPDSDLSQGELEKLEEWKYKNNL